MFGDASTTGCIPTRWQTYRTHTSRRGLQFARSLVRSVPTQRGLRDRTRGRVDQSSCPCYPQRSRIRDVGVGDSVQKNHSLVPPNTSTVTDMNLVRNGVNKYTVGNEYETMNETRELTADCTKMCSYSTESNHMDGTASVRHHSIEGYVMYSDSVAASNGSDSTSTRTDSVGATQTIVSHQAIRRRQDVMYGRRHYHHGSHWLLAAGVCRRRNIQAANKHLPAILHFRYPDRAFLNAMANIESEQILRWTFCRSSTAFALHWHISSHIFCVDPTHFICVC